MFIGQSFDLFLSITKQQNLISPTTYLPPKYLKMK